MRKTLVVFIAATAATALIACGSTKTVTVTSTLTTATQLSTTSTSEPTASSTTTTTTADSKVSKSCDVTGVSQVKNGSVTVQLTASGYPASSSNLVGCSTATDLVNIIAKQKAEMPVKTNNFNCTPTVNGNAADFTCAVIATDKGKINYQFVLNYN
ncbi:MAG: hypothetical protein WCL20_01520 [Actinomycetes bacterium]